MKSAACEHGYTGDERDNCACAPCMARSDERTAATVERPVKCRRYKHGGARFYTVDAKGVERLLADTYNAKATERVAAALDAEVVVMS